MLLKLRLMERCVVKDVDIFYCIYYAEKNMLRNISWWGEFPFIKKGWGNF